MKPETRRSGLLIRELPDELLVYDQERHRAHCLNRTAALVFRHADGTRSVADLARAFDPAAGPAEEEVVKLALAQLAAGGLLEGESAVEAPARLTRRDLARRVGIAAAVLLPAVATIVAPTPAEAAATCVTSCAGQPNGTRCDVCGAGINCDTTIHTCMSQACTDGCPNP
jgi:hypothetical protein